jgi:hypothetical protein
MGPMPFPTERRRANGMNRMIEHIKLDPLVNQRVIFKLRSETSTMDATILGSDDAGYWIKGGTLAEHLENDEVSDSETDVSLSRD